MASRERCVEATQGVKRLGWCGGVRLEERKRAARSGDYKRRLSAHSVLRVCYNGEWRVAGDGDGYVGDADLCSRAASSTHERDQESVASGGSLPETSRVGLRSLACPKRLAARVPGVSVRVKAFYFATTTVVVDAVTATAFRECVAEFPTFQ